MDHWFFAMKEVMSAEAPTAVALVEKVPVEPGTGRTFPEPRAQAKGPLLQACTLGSGGNAAMHRRKGGKLRHTGLQKQPAHNTLPQTSQLPHCR